MPVPVHTMRWRKRWIIRIPIGSTQIARQRTLRHSALSLVRTIEIACATRSPPKIQALSGPESAGGAVPALLSPTRAAKSRMQKMRRLAQMGQTTASKLAHGAQLGAHRAGPLAGSSPKLSWGTSWLCMSGGQLVRLGGIDAAVKYVLVFF